LGSCDVSQTSLLAGPSLSCENSNSATAGPVPVPKLLLKKESASVQRAHRSCNEEQSLHTEGRGWCFVCLPVCLPLFSSLPFPVLLSLWLRDASVRLRRPWIFTFYSNVSLVSLI
jgi:hypothetical protein